ncbi:hypothetical protein BDV95DRAFT_586222 [Massariosphaeria phaeospora]|uniref:Uncharacterized protein n=1 Tax=Massariosphaeria phaeospora TaxID=100035 RepID=A0A7C8M1W6_9PLEO|nr:hypothetical protein BDV95DRAFT_586222 [Massariosphaeria phaeospora]
MCTPQTLSCEPSQIPLPSTPPIPAPSTPAPPTAEPSQQPDPSPSNSSHAAPPSSSTASSSQPRTSTSTTTSSRQELVHPAFRDSGANRGSTELLKATYIGYKDPRLSTEVPKRGGSEDPGPIVLSERTEEKNINPGTEGVVVSSPDIADGLTTATPPIDIALTNEGSVSSSNSGQLFSGGSSSPKEDEASSSWEDNLNDLAQYSAEIKADANRRSTWHVPERRKLPKPSSVPASPQLEHDIPDLAVPTKTIRRSHSTSEIPRRPVSQSPRPVARPPKEWTLVVPEGSDTMSLFMLGRKMTGAARSALLQGPKLAVVNALTGETYAKAVPERMLLQFCGTKVVDRLRSKPGAVQVIEIPDLDAEQGGIERVIRYMRRCCGTAHGRPTGELRVPPSVMEGIETVRACRVLGLNTDADRIEDYVVNEVLGNRALKLEDVELVWEGYHGKLRKTAYADVVLWYILNHIVGDVAAFTGGIGFLLELDDYKALRDRVKVEVVDAKWRFEKREQFLRRCALERKTERLMKEKRRMSRRDVDTELDKGDGGALDKVSIRAWKRLSGYSSDVDLEGAVGSLSRNPLSSLSLPSSRNQTSMLNQALPESAVAAASSSRLSTNPTPQGEPTVRVHHVDYTNYTRPEAPPRTAQALWKDLPGFDIPYADSWPGGRDPSPSLPERKTARDRLSVQMREDDRARIAPWTTGASNQAEAGAAPRGCCLRGWRVKVAELTGKRGSGLGPK